MGTLQGLWEAHWKATGNMKSVALLLCCGLLLLLVGLREHHQRRARLRANQQRFLRDLRVAAMAQRMIEEIPVTAHELGVWVGSTDESLVAEVVSRSSAFYPAGK